MANQKYKILLVDDEPDILEFLSYNLNREGYEVFTSQNGKEGIAMALKHKPHLILMDVMMPDMDGIEACEHMRTIDALRGSVIAFLTARSEDYSQIAGFEAGADDYIAKPVKLKVLSNRIKALLKRFSENNTELENERTNSKVQYGNIEIDRERYIVINSGIEMVLPKKEFELLLLLSSKPDKVFTRDSIFRHVWGDDVVVGGRTIDVHIRKLREKIGSNHIITIKGVGYKFKE
jgi:two-component system, OmpR family, alkaline phosphatase synthesis response regulator PhoP